MTDLKYFQSWTDPLVFFPLEEAWAGKVREQLVADSPVKYLCPPGADATLDALRTRYKEISGESKCLITAPAEDNILSKLIWPLRNAKASYVLGNYIGAISLCGMLCELLALLVYEISEVKFNGRPSDPKNESEQFGAPFEKLGQDRKILILKSLNLIDDGLNSSLDLVRRKCRTYLHFFSEEHTNIHSDALEVFNCTVAAVDRIIGQDVQEGEVVINPSLIKYLQAKGIGCSEPASGMPVHDGSKRDTGH